MIKGVGGTPMITAYTVLIVAFVLGYLATIFYFIGYLRRAHTAVWANIGRPDFSKVQGASIDVQFRQLLALFSTWKFIFTGAHNRMSDSRLSALVWLLRILIVGCLFLFAGLFALR